jgi:hypothetical protein
MLHAHRPTSRQPLNAVQLHVLSDLVGIGLVWGEYVRTMILLAPWEPPVRNQKRSLSFQLRSSYGPQQLVQPPHDESARGATAAADGRTSEESSFRGPGPSATAAAPGAARRV